METNDAVSNIVDGLSRRVDKCEQVDKLGEVLYLKACLKKEHVRIWI